MNPNSTRRSTVKSIGALFVSLMAAGCSDDGGSDEDDNTIDMTDDLTFEPDELTINVSDTVVWENVGESGHTVTAYEEEIPDDAEYFASGEFDSEEAARDAYSPGDTDSGDIPGGESYEYIFETPGTYEYFCIPHENAGMVGTIDVQEE